MRRTVAGLVALLIASILIYGAVAVLPGNAAQYALGRFGTPQRLALVEANLHMNRPLPTRYLDWLGGLVTGHLGDSTAALVAGTTLPVASEIAKPLRNSLILAGITLALFIPLSLLLGTAAALRVGRTRDRVISLSALVVSAMPEFLIGTLLILLFFTEFNLLPPLSTIYGGQTPLSHPTQLVLPVLTLLGVSLAYGLRLVRAMMVETMRSDYVTFARLNGQSERRVILHCGLRNALAPSIQALALTIQYLIGGIIIVESVFSYPGIGTQLVEAVLARDVQTVAVISALLAAVYVGVNILADLCVTLIVPKLRTQL